MPKDSIPVYVHGLRNTTAKFGEANVQMYFGGQVASPSTNERPAVLLTIEGVDAANGKVIDIEVAVSVDQIGRFIELLQDRKKGLSGGA